MARLITYGDIARFQPNLLTGRLEALKAITATFAPTQALPKPPIGRAAAVLLAAENSMMLSDQLFTVIAHHLAERCTDIKNLTLRWKFYQRHVSVQCAQDFLLMGDLNLGLEQGWFMAIEQHVLTSGDGIVPNNQKRLKTWLQTLTGLYNREIKVDHRHIKLCLLQSVFLL